MLQTDLTRSKGSGRSWTRVGVLVLSIAIQSLCGCGGGAPQSPATGAPPVRDPIPVVTDPTSFSVRFYTTEGQYLVDKLEIEFYGGRRGKHEIYGFHRDAYDTMDQIPFASLSRVDFMSQLDSSLFDQIVSGREQLGLSIDNAFVLRLTYKDSRQEEFFGFIPKFRGVKDFDPKWELGLNSAARYLLYMEFEKR